MKKNIKIGLLSIGIFMLSFGTSFVIGYNNDLTKPEKVYAKELDNMEDITTEILNVTNETIDDIKTEDVTNEATTEEMVIEEPEEETEAEKYTRTAEYYKEMYAPKVKPTVTIGEYTFDYIEGAPYSVYEQMAHNKDIEAEKLRRAEEERLAQEEAERQAEEESVAQEQYISETYEIPTEGCLTPSAGVFNGPSGKETYYNLPMDGVVSIMRSYGFSEEEYPYWVREDGCKMLGPYIMVAANLDVHPRGTTVECSLGTALVCDTGGFAASNPNQLDIAVNW